jgi:hypothetical protein
MDRVAEAKSWLQQLLQYGSGPGISHVGNKKKWMPRFQDNLLKYRVIKRTGIGRGNSPFIYSIVDKEKVNKLLADDQLLDAVIKIPTERLQNVPEDGVPPPLPVIVQVEHSSAPSPSNGQDEDVKKMVELSLRLLGGMIDKMDRIERQNLEILSILKVLM